MRSIFSNFLDSVAADVEVMKSSEADQLPDPKAEIEPSQSLKVQQFPASEIEMTHCHLQPSNWNTVESKMF